MKQETIHSEQSTIRGLASSLLPSSRSRTSLSQHTLHRPIKVESDTDELVAEKMKEIQARLRTRLKTMQFIDLPRTSSDEYQKEKKGGWLSPMLVAYAFLTAFLFVKLLWEAAQQQQLLSSSLPELEDIEAEIAKDPKLTSHEEASLRKTTCSLEQDLDLGLVQHWLVIGTFVYTLLVSSLQLIVYLATASEGRDKVAFALICMILARLVLLPSSILLAIWTGSSLSSLEGTEEAYTEDGVRYEALDSFIEDQISSCSAMWRLFIACGVVIGSEALLVFLGFVVHLVSRKGEETEEPVFLITNEMLTKGLVAEVAGPTPLREKEASTLEVNPNTAAGVLEARDARDEEKQAALSSRLEVQDPLLRPPTSPPSESEEPFAPHEIDPPQKAFSMRRFKQQLHALNHQGKTNQMQIEIYVEMLSECLKLFSHFGTVIRLAFIDISDKANKIKENQKLLVEHSFIASDSSAAAAIEQLICFEFENHLALLNQSNNRSILNEHYAHMSSAERRRLSNYLSTAWVVIRGAWFFDYLTEIFRLIDEDRKSALSQIALQAYDTALAPRHPWFVQRAARLGMRACCSRRAFIDSLCKEQSVVLGARYDDEEFYRGVRELSSEFKMLGEHLWEFFAEQGTDEVP